MNPNEFLEKVRNPELLNTIKQEANEKLEKLGIPRVHAPDNSEEPRYPGDTTSLDLKTLGKLYGEFMGWSAYCKHLFRLKEADVLLAKNMVSQARRWVMNERGISGATKKEKDIIDADETVLQLEAVQTEFEVQKATLEARLDWFDECAKALSREITRRQMEVEKTGINL